MVLLFRMSCGKGVGAPPGFGGQKGPSKPPGFPGPNKPPKGNGKKGPCDFCDCRGCPECRKWKPLDQETCGQVIGKAQRRWRSRICKACYQWLYDSGMGLDPSGHLTPAQLANLPQLLAPLPLTPEELADAGGNVDAGYRSI